MTAHFRCLRAVLRARLLHGASAACALSRAHVSSSLRFFAQLQCIAFSFSPRAFRARNHCCEFFHNCDASPSPCRLARSVRATVAANFSTFLPPRRAKRRGAASNALACGQLPHCRYRKKWVCTEISSLLSRTTDVPALKQRFLDYGLPDLTGKLHFSRALGPTDDQAGDRIGSVGMRGLTQRRKDATCAADSLPLVRRSRPSNATGSRHTTQPTHAGVGGHHTTVSPLFFIAYPQTRVPAPSVLGPYADATGVGPSTHCSTALKRVPNLS
jgi:hypothetical protein